MAITRTPIIDDDGTGTTGTVIDSLWKTELYNQIDADPAWVAVPYAQSHFMSVGNNWYVGAANVIQSYSVKGKVASILLGIQGSQNYVTSYTLQVTGWPFTFAPIMTGVWFGAITSAAPAGGWGPALVTIDAANQLDFRRTNFSDWPVTGADFSLSCLLTLPIL